MGIETQAFSWYATGHIIEIVFFKKLGQNHHVGLID